MSRHTDEREDFKYVATRYQVLENSFIPLRENSCRGLKRKDILVRRNQVLCTRFFFASFA
jgi:hypothetical protein